MKRQILTSSTNTAWGEFHSPFERACGLRLLDLPMCAWNNKNHLIQCNGDWALTKGNPAGTTVYHGDVYALQQDGGGGEGEGEIVGVMPAVKFRQYLRVLLDRFFSAAVVENPDSARGVSVGVASSHGGSSMKPDPASEAVPASSRTKPVQPMLESSEQLIPEPTLKSTAEPADKEETILIAPKTATATPKATSSSAAHRTMALVAAETGVGSLASLAIAEKPREQGGIRRQRQPLPRAWPLATCGRGCQSTIANSLVDWLAGRLVGACLDEGGPMLVLCVLFAVFIHVCLSLSGGRGQIVGLETLVVLKDQWMELLERRETLDIHPETSRSRHRK